MENGKTHIKDTPISNKYYGQSDGLIIIYENTYIYYVFHGSVTLFFADNFSTECRDHHEIFTQFFSDHEVILRSHIMFINASTKEFTLVNNTSTRHDVAFEHLLYYKMVANAY